LGRWDTFPPPLSQFFFSDGFDFHGLPVFFVVCLHNVFAPSFAIHYSTALGCLPFSPLGHSPSSTMQPGSSLVHRWFFFFFLTQSTSLRFDPSPHAPLHHHYRPPSYQPPPCDPPPTQHALKCELHAPELDLTCWRVFPIPRVVDSSDHSSTITTSLLALHHLLVFRFLHYTCLNVELTHRRVLPTP
jgi:hypothetical protein